MAGKVRPVVKALLPSEHGSWAFVLEPILIGGILGHNLQAWLLGLGGFLGFLAFRPALLAFADLSKGKRYPRTIPALIVSVTLGLFSFALLASFWVSNPAASPTLTAFLALGVVFLIVDHRAKPRSLWRELLGAILTIPISLSMALPKGHDFLTLVCALLVLRAVTAVLTVRGIIGRSEDSRFGAIAAMLIGLSLPILSYQIGSIWLAAAYGIVTLRSLWFGLTPGRARAAKSIGFQELAVSLAIVCAWLLVA